MTLYKGLAGLSAALAILSLTIPLCAAPKVSQGERVKQVAPANVCFINKQHFDKPQTPVAVDGKMYYGCCPGCTQTLQNDPKSRVEVDPVSGKEVDKAKAVIGADKNGKVYFFENVENLKKFRVPANQ